MQHDTETAHHVSVIVNEMLSAKSGNKRHTAAGLLAVAQVLMHHDPLGRIAFAVVLSEAIAELLSDIDPEQLGALIRVRSGSCLS